MSVAVGILDRDAWSSRTDNLAVLDGGNAEIKFVPRDLWCEVLADRVNVAYARGGAGLLRRALSEHGLEVDGVLCLRRRAVETALRDVRVSVPVDRPLRFLYPLTPTAFLEDGSREISFDPPVETLAGERLHQWIGARKVPGGVGSDFDRIARQQQLLRRLAEEGFHFDCLFSDETLYRWHGSEAGWRELMGIRAGWRFSVFDDVAPCIVEGKDVLVSRGGPRGPK